MKGVSNKQLNELRNSPCWEWPATVNPSGYAVRMKQGKYKRVHRLVYEAVVEDIPDGLVSDHLCRNRKCVNPFHIEIVTNRENVLRGVGVTAKNVKKTHCPSGHPYDGNNLYVLNGARACRTCVNIHGRKRRTKIKEALQGK